MCIRDSGTDVHIYHGEAGSAEVTPPVVLGHEYAGIVEEVGADVKGCLLYTSAHRGDSGIDDAVRTKQRIKNTEDDDP